MTRDKVTKYRLKSQMLKLKSQIDILNLKSLIINRGVFIALLFTVSCLLLALVLYPDPLGKAASSAYTLTPIYASESTPSADVKSKLQALQAEIASKAAKLKTEIGNKLKDKAYVGIIKDKATDSLKIQLKSGEKTIRVNQFTVFQPKNVTLKTLLKEDMIVALGDADENGDLTAKKVIKLTKKEAINKSTIWGQVASKETKSLTIKQADGQQQVLKVTAKTIYQVGKEVGSWEDIKLSKALAVVVIKAGEDLQARFIYILPYAVKMKAKEATASAKIKTATPSATATSSAKASSKAK